MKKNIESVQGSDVYPAAQQMLIHQGKVLEDDTTMEQNKVSENSFMVIMLSKVNFHYYTSINSCLLDDLHECRTRAPPLILFPLQWRQRQRHHPLNRRHPPQTQIRLHLRLYTTKQHHIWLKESIYQAQSTGFFRWVEVHGTESPSSVPFMLLSTTQKEPLNISIPAYPTHLIFL